MAEALLDRPRVIPGVEPLAPRALAWQRRLTVIMTVFPFAGLVWAAWSLWGRGIGAPEAIVAGVFYAFTGLGISVGFHRYFTHKAFRAPAAVRVMLAVAGSMAVEGPILNWVATHRRHHAFADEPGDPHSPHVDAGDGVRGALRGLWHAHTGWLFVDEWTSHERWCPDLVKDPAIARVNRLFGVWTLLTFGLPMLAGYAITGTLRGAVMSFVWGGLVRVFMLHHATWSINSICHFYGRRPFEAKDEARNTWQLSWITFGEAWHNNHHAFPSSAFLGLRWWEVDVGGYAIRLMHALRLVRDVRVPTREQQLAKRAPRA